MPPVPTPATFLFLVDRAYVADRQLGVTYEWPQLPATALTRIADTLPLLKLRSQDSVEIAWISGASFEAGEVVLGATSGPADPPFSLPLRPDLPARAENYCGTAQDDRNLLAKAWRTQAQMAVDQFRTELAKSQAEYGSTLARRLASIEPLKDPRGTDIEGALVRAMTVRAKAADRRVEVILFTDLNATVSHGAAVDLLGIDLVIALFHRANPADYLRAKQEWQDRFASVHVGHLTFLSWDDSSAPELTMALGR